MLSLEIRDKDPSGGPHWLPPVLSLVEIDKDPDWLPPVLSLVEIDKDPDWLPPVLSLVEIDKIGFRQCYLL